MILPIWQQIMHIVSLDQKINQINQSIIVCQKQIETHKTHKTTLSKNSSEQEIEITQIKNSIKLFEEKINEIRKSEIEKKKVLDTVHNQKEYNSLKRELDILSTAHQDQENLLLTNWHKFETLEKKLEQEKIAYQINVEKIDQEIKQLEDKIIEDATLLKNLETEQQVAIKNLPKEWQTKYEHMKGKVSDPIVPVIDDSCSVCFYMVLSSDLVKIKKGSIMPCRNCYRFLYYDKNEEKAAHTASY